MPNNHISIDGNHNLVIQDVHGSHIYVNSDEDVQRLLAEQGHKLDQILQSLKAQPSAVSQQWADKIYNIQQAGTVNFNFYGEKKIPKNLTPPPFRSDLFLGRERDLQAIHDLFFEQYEALVLLNGVGGIGKTTLASRYYLQHQSEYSHVGWLLTEPSLEDALLRLALPLRLEFEDKTLPEERLERILQQITELPAPVLLILDNANDLDNLEANHQFLRRFHNVHLLLTTRINTLDQAKIYHIGSLDLNQSKNLFKKYYPKHQESEDLLLEQIYHAVNGNTLLIELLAKNLQQLKPIKVNYTLSSVLNDLQNLGLLAINSKEVSTDYALEKSKPEEIIAAMYDLGDLEQEEKRLMSIFSVLPAEAIPFENLVELLPNTSRLDNILMELSKKGWLDLFESQAVFKCSPVVQLIIRKKNPNLLLDCKELIDSLKEKMRSAWEEYYQNHETTISFVRYTTSIVNSFKIIDNDIGILCDKIGGFYESSGNLLLAHDYFQRFHQIEQKLLEAAPGSIYFTKGLAVAAERLGDLHISLGKFEEAKVFLLEYHRLSIELSKMNPEEIDYSSMLSMSFAWLGQIYLELNELEIALSYFEQYRNISDLLTEKEPDNPVYKNRLAHSYSKIGQVHVTMGALELAFDYFKMRNAISEQIYTNQPNNLSYKNSFADSRAKMGLVYLMMDKKDLAQNYLIEYCDVMEEIHQSNTFDNWVMKSNYAESLAVKAALIPNDDPLSSNYYQQAQELFDALYQKSGMKNIDHKKNLVAQMQQSKSYAYQGVVELLS